MEIIHVPPPLVSPTFIFSIFDYRCPLVAVDKLMMFTLGVIYAMDFDQSINIFTFIKCK